MEQSNLAAMYRSNFNRVDLIDRRALGDHSLIKAWATKNVFHRIFSAFLAFSETNAYNALIATRPDFAQMTRLDWRKELSNALLRRDSPMQLRPRATPIISHMMMVKLDKAKRCTKCKDKTNRGTLCGYACECGVVVCATTTGRPCFAQHLCDTLNDEEPKDKRLRK